MKFYLVLKSSSHKNNKYVNKIEKHTKYQENHKLKYANKKPPQQQLLKISNGNKLPQCLKVYYILHLNAGFMGMMGVVGVRIPSVYRYFRFILCLDLCIGFYCTSVSGECIIDLHRQKVTETITSNVM